jgi:hypothetical protein
MRITNRLSLLTVSSLCVGMLIALPVLAEDMEETTASDTEATPAPEGEAAPAPVAEVAPAPEVAAEPVTAGTARSVPMLFLTMEDMSGASWAALSLPMIPGDHYFGMAPSLSGQWGMGALAFGLDVPLAYAAPDEGDGKFVLGAPTLKAKYTLCQEGNLCFGGMLSLGLGFMGLSDDAADMAMEAMAHAVGAVGHQNMENHAIETIAVVPKGYVSYRQGALLTQAEVGFGVLIPTNEGDTEMSLEYRAGVGYLLMDMVAPMLELSAITPLTQEGADTAFWINLGARGIFGGLQPYLRLSLPLSDAAKAGADIQFDLGAAFLF